MKLVLFTPILQKSWDFDPGSLATEPVLSLKILWFYEKSLAKELRSLFITSFMLWLKSKQ